MYAPNRLGADGANLLPVLNRLANADLFALNDIERDLAGISDETLRAMALAVSKHDPEQYGVHPGQLKQMARLLQSMATGLDEAQDTQQDAPQRYNLNIVPVIPVQNG